MYMPRDKDRKNAKDREWYQNNKERKKQQDIAWRASNPEKYNIQLNNYHKETKEKLIPLIKSSHLKDFLIEITKTL
jgi:hypothetical protein